MWSSTSKRFHNDYSLSNGNVPVRSLWSIDGRSPGIHEEISSVNRCISHSKFAYFTSFTRHSTEMDSRCWCTAHQTWQFTIQIFCFRSHGFLRRWEKFVVSTYSPSVLLPSYLPCGFMPTERHFWNRQYWHWVRDRFVIRQVRSRWHLYFFFPSPVDIERKKNF